METSIIVLSLLLAHFIGSFIYLALFVLLHKKQNALIEIVFGIQAEEKHPILKSAFWEIMFIFNTPNFIFATTLGIALFTGLLHDSMVSKNTTESVFLLCKFNKNPAACCGGCKKNQQ